MSQSASLIGIVVVDGVLHQRYVDRHGKEQLVPVPTAPPSSPSFVDTETIPHDWTPRDSEVLEPKAKSAMLTRDEHVKRSCQLEALLVKVFTRSCPDTQRLDVKGNTALKEIIQDLCLIAGGEWITRAKDIV